MLKGAIKNNFLSSKMIFLSATVISIDKFLFWTNFVISSLILNYFFRPPAVVFISISIYRLNLLKKWLGLINSDMHYQLVNKFHNIFIQKGYSVWRNCDLKSLNRWSNIYNEPLVCSSMIKMSGNSFLTSTFDSSAGPD